VINLRHTLQNEYDWLIEDGPEAGSRESFQSSQLSKPVTINTRDTQKYRIPSHFYGLTPPVGLRTLIVEVWRPRSLHNIRWDSSGRVIFPTQRRILKNMQQPQATDIQAPAGFEPEILASKRPQTHALDCTAAGIGQIYHLTTLC
jgi:hypothetical protein